jgi:hypothetical protein
MSILLNRRSSHLVGASVVTEVNDFTTHRLEDSSEDSNRRIVTVEDGRCGNHTQWSARRCFGGCIIRHSLSKNYSLINQPTSAKLRIVINF